MAECQLYRAGDGWWSCSVCKRRRFSPSTKCESGRCYAWCEGDPREPEQCRHFLCWTDRTALAICGCASQHKNGSPTTIAECDLHGDVTPLAKKTKEQLPSCTCNDFQPED